MDEYKIYFAEEGKPGITMDKAQRLCVWADKMMMDAQAAISSVNFVGEKEITFNRKELVTVVGDSQICFDEEIKNMIALTSLMSWLHEAINAKKTLVQNAFNLTIEDWAKENGIEIPERPTVRLRRRIRRDEHDEYVLQFMSKWEPEKVARYYRLQNTCAILHKLVGEDAPYETAIKRLMEITKKPRVKSWHGEKLYVTEFTPSVDVEAAFKQYKAYQWQHSQAQSELNALKSELEQDKKRYEAQIFQKGKEEYAAYNDKMHAIESEFSAVFAQRIDEAQKLKIRIPENLMDIFNTVRSMGQEPIDVD